MDSILTHQFSEIDFDYKRPSLLRKILGLIYSPSKTLNLLSKIPDNRIPLLNTSLIILFTSLPYLFLIFHLTVSGSDIFISMITNYFLSSFLSVLFVNVLLLTLSWALLAFIYWILLKYFNKRISYNEIFKLTVQCLTPLIFSRVFLTLSVYVALPNINIIEGESLELISNQISILFNSYNWILYKFIDDGVWLWSALLISIGFKEYYNVNFKKSLFISFTVIISYLLILNIPL
ncbi:MAG: YIP1 family protein [Candidatus Odinarchaeum yellowstonii]|uniref:YIP1 family protein n=1 Tax=Odinarchaeota yellowstonii (strain LCB_4) TaxID=1841599 RepID=A0AAF0IBI2_ODILC|nr:MAG: YIP1 family protein [Candidatus Odinarchaeum yellowstonii]